VTAIYVNGATSEDRGSTIQKIDPRDLELNSLLRRPKSRRWKPSYWPAKAKVNEAEATLAKSRESAEGWRGLDLGVHQR